MSTRVVKSIQRDYVMVKVLFDDKTRITLTKNKWGEKLSLSQPEGAVAPTREQTKALLHSWNVRSGETAIEAAERLEACAARATSLRTFAAACHA